MARAAEEEELTDAMDGSYDEYADGSIESGTREDAGDELTGLVRSLRRTREACVRFSRHVDAGVVAGLGVGAGSILYHYARALRGVDPPADASLPRA